MYTATVEGSMQETNADSFRKCNDSFSCYRHYIGFTLKMSLHLYTLLTCLRYDRSV